MNKSNMKNSKFLISHSSPLIFHKVFYRVPCLKT